MKKLIFNIVFLFVMVITAQAQLKEGDDLLGPTLGLWTEPNLPTFGMNYEHQMSQLGDVATISLGAVLRYTNFNDSYQSPNYYSRSYVTFGAQSNISFNRISDGKFVPFLGLVLGYNSVNYTYTNRNGNIIYDESYTSGFWLWGQAGMRYFFSPKVAGVLRLGAGNFNFNAIELGIDFKL